MDDLQIMYDKIIKSYNHKQNLMKKEQPVKCKISTFQLHFH